MNWVYAHEIKFDLSLYHNVNSKPSFDLDTDRTKRIFIGIICRVLSPPSNSFFNYHDWTLEWKSMQVLLGFYMLAWKEALDGTF